MIITLSGGPYGGVSLEVLPDSLIDFSFNVAPFAVYAIDGTFIGLNVSYTGTVFNRPIDDVFLNTRNKLWEAIKIERDRRKEGGVAVSGYWFHSDTSSRIQQLGLLVMGANIPPNTPWKTMSGAKIIMTQTLASKIFMAAAVSDITTFGYAEYLKSIVFAAEDPNTINYLAGWPLIYGE